jgi:hypothetical protein
MPVRVETISSITMTAAQNPVKAPDGVGNALILTKPFRGRDLAAMLRSALSAPSR